MPRRANANKSNRSKSCSTVRFKPKVCRRHNAKKQPKIAAKIQKGKKKSKRSNKTIVELELMRFIQNRFENLENILRQNNLRRINQSATNQSICDQSITLSPINQSVINQSICDQSLSCSCGGFLSDADNYSDECEDDDDPRGRESAEQVFSEANMARSPEMFHNETHNVPYGSAGYLAMSSVSEDGLDRPPQEMLLGSMSETNIEEEMSDLPILYPSGGRKKNYGNPDVTEASCSEANLGATMAARAASEENDDCLEESDPETGSQCSQANSQQSFEPAGSNAPLPSLGCKPTYIVMVKTAVRDLRPFRMTTRNSISRYINLRYRVRNDCMLDYVLDWLVTMKILNNVCGHYTFSRKRLVKKTTVALLPCKKRPCRVKKRCGPCRPYRSCKPRKCRKRRRRPRRRCGVLIGSLPECDDVYPGCNPCCLKRPYCDEFSDCDEVVRCAVKKRRCNSPCRPRRCNSPCKPRRCNSPCKPRRCNSPCKPRRCNTPYKTKCCPKTGEPKCTCSKEVSAVKNRVKLKSRYVRRRGKIYKEEEFI